MPITAKWSAFRDSLSGYPADLVSEHLQTEAGLTSALRTLDHVFQGTDKAIAALKRKLSELPAGQDTESCWMNCCLLEGMLLSLAHFGYPVDTDPSIRSQYRQKFPPEVSSAISEDDMSLQQMQDVAKELILEAKRKGEELGRPALSEQPKNDAVQEHCASSEWISFLIHLLAVGLLCIPFYALLPVSDFLYLVCNTHFSKALFAGVFQ